MKVFIPYTKLWHLAVWALLIQSCTAKKENQVAEKFVINDSLISKLLVDTVQQADNKTDLSFSARITVDDELKADIFPMVGGTVSQVVVKLGDRVNKGQVLARLGSAEIAGFDKDVISAKAELNIAERALNQQRELFKSGLASERELEEAKNEFLIKEAELKRSNAALKFNGGSTEGAYSIKSPLSGFVIEKNVTSNMQLRPDNNSSLFTVADLSTVWAMINIYESDISRIKEGDEVDLNMLSYPDRAFKGKIDKIYNILDQESKVMTARVSIINKDFALKPGMMGTVKIVGRAPSSHPVVNSRGIIFDENKHYAVVLDDQKKVHIREVEIGRKTTDKAYISKGLNPGDRIIASKQVFLFESLKN